MSKSNPWLPLLTPHQLVEISSAFKRFDRDGDGHIEPHELKIVMSNLGCPQDEAGIKKLIASVDTDGNGMIEFDEFIGVMAKRMLRSDEDSELEQALLLFDDGNGKVHVDDIRSMFTEMGSYRLSSDDLDGMIGMLRPDSSGNVSIDDFRALDCWRVPLPDASPSPAAKAPDSAAAAGGGA